MATAAHAVNPGADRMTHREMPGRSSLSDIICLLAVTAALVWLVFLRR